MTLLAEVFDPAELAAAVETGHVRVQRHPSRSYEIYNYTEACQYAGAWTAVTLACRGLIVDASSGVVLARPLEKFFNHSEPQAPELRPEAPVAVTDKADGCFPRQTALNLWGGGTITIAEVVRKRLSVTLVGMNAEGDMVPAIVTDWHDNGRKDHWLDIEVDAPVSRRSGAAGHPNRLRVTVNHHIYANGEYRAACEVQPGDTLITQTWEPTSDVLHIIRASMLGDGCLMASATRPTQAKYAEPHTAKQADYVHALRKALGECAANRNDTVSGYGSKMLWVGSREYAALGTLRAEWYPEGIKVVPDDLSWVDDFAVAKWLMDDGYRQKFPAQADRISFATNSFRREDIVRLGDRLAEMYGITFFLNDDGGRGLALVINSGRKQQIRRLWHAIAPHVHPSMRYKLPEEFHAVPYQEMPIGHEVVRPRSVRVVAVTPVASTKRNFPSGRTGYDISTSTHNYLARGVLVHNSLGIIYPDRNKLAIATRGSFTSDQALHATEVLRSRYPEFVPRAGLTVLVEIVYPANRIVLDYGGLDDLILLGAVDIATGRTFGPGAVPQWPGPVVDTFAYATLAEALAAPPRDGREGLVVHFTDSDERVKIKYAEYVRLHRLVTGLSARTVWEVLVSGGDLDALIEPLPDEFHAWVTAVATELTDAVAALAKAVEAEFAAILAELPDGWGRREFAARAVRSEHRGALFLRLDGKDYRPGLWQLVRPAGDVTPSGTKVSEE